MGLLAKLHCLGTTAGAWLIEQAAGMRLDRVLAHKEALGDFRLLTPAATRLRISSSRGVIPSLLIHCWSGANRAAAGAGSSILRVNVNPSQMPRGAKMAAMRPP
jgi:hypothetical protein